MTSNTSTANSELATENYTRFQLSFSEKYGLQNLSNIRKHLIPLALRLYVPVAEAEDLLSDLLTYILENELSHCDTLIDPHDIMSDPRIKVYLKTAYVNRVIRYLRKMRCRRHQYHHSHIECIRGLDAHYDIATDLGLESHDDPEKTFSKVESIDLLLEVFDKLDPLYKDALVLRYFMGLSYLETADELNIPIGTVRSRIHNAIDKLRNLMKGRLGKESFALETSYPY